MVTDAVVGVNSRITGDPPHPAEWVLDTFIPGPARAARATRTSETLTQEEIQ